MQTSKTMNSRLPIVLAAVAIVANLFIANGILGSLAFAMWFGVALWRIAPRLPGHDQLAKFFFAALVLGTALTAGSLAIYFLLPVNALSVGGLFVVLTALVLYIEAEKRITFLTPDAFSILRPSFGNVPPWILWLLATLQCVTLLFLAAARTSEPLVSPWTILPASIFVFFFLSCVLTLYVQQRGTNATLIFGALQVFLAVGLSAIVYGVGFGFDPFVHRAAEAALVATGHIEPLSLLYSGQYALVGALHLLTQLPVLVIDISLLP
ncbi:MAG: hypothetical protein NUV56_01740, partial [Candidatus Uhrbacteria bacterium]|nr:hypothetical protein [Candidatus Uhrbacteria bacterium]